MKIFIAAALFFAPLAAWAQDREADELKRDLEKRLAELEKNFNEQRARIKEEFARQLERRKQPDRKPDERRHEGTGLENIMERLEKRLGDLDRRLGELERHFGGGDRERRQPDNPRPPQPPRQPEQAQKFFRQQFDFNNQDWQQWMQQGRRFWEGGEARDALRGAVEELKRMLDRDQKTPHLEDAMELLKKIIERRDHREEERRPAPKDKMREDRREGEDKRPAPQEKKREDRRNFF